MKCCCIYSAETILHLEKNFKQDITMHSVMIVAGTSLQLSLASPIGGHTRGLHVIHCDPYPMIDMLVLGG